MMITMMAARGREQQAIPLHEILCGEVPPLVCASVHVFMIMLKSALLVALSGGVVNCRSYASDASTLQERGWAMAMVSASQGLGFVIGPGTVLLLLLFGIFVVRVVDVAGCFALK